MCTLSPRAEANVELQSVHTTLLDLSSKGKLGVRKLLFWWGCLVETAGTDEKEAVSP